MSNLSKDAFGYDTGIVVGPSTQNRIKAVYEISCVNATFHNSANLTGEAFHPVHGGFGECDIAGVPASVGVNAEIIPQAEASKPFFTLLM